jgi:hypothetical protein
MEDEGRISRRREGWLDRFRDLKAELVKHWETPSQSYQEWKSMFKISDMPGGAKLKQVRILYHSDKKLFDIYLIFNNGDYESIAENIEAYYTYVEDNVEGLGTVVTVKPVKILTIKTDILEMYREKFEFKCSKELFVTRMKFIKEEFMDWENIDETSR